MLKIRLKFKNKFTSPYKKIEENENNVPEMCVSIGNFAKMFGNNFYLAVGVHSIYSCVAKLIVMIYIKTT